MRKGLGEKGKILGGAVGIIGFCILLYFVMTGGAEVFDDAIRKFFYSMREDHLTSGVKILTYMGNWQTIVVLCVGLLLFRKTRSTYGVPVSVGAVMVTVLNKALKHIVERSRPDDVMHLVNEGGFSFPSGHSITSIFVYGMLIYLIRRNVKNRKTANVLTIILLIPAIFIGISRIYLGVHYPTDVLAGWCLGIAVLLWMAKALEILEIRKKRS